MTYDDESQIEGLDNIEFIDTRTLKGKKEAKRLKSHWAALKDPFIVIYKDDKPIKLFYSEEKGDIIAKFKKYMNENFSTWRYSRQNYLEGYN